MTERARFSPVAVAEVYRAANSSRLPVWRFGTADGDQHDTTDLGWPGPECRSLTTFPPSLTWCHRSIRFTSGRPLARRSAQTMHESACPPPAPPRHRRAIPSDRRQYFPHARVHHRAIADEHRGHGLVSVGDGSHPCGCLRVFPDVDLSKPNTAAAQGTSSILQNGQPGRQYTSTSGSVVPGSLITSPCPCRANAHISPAVTTHRRLLS